MQLRINERIWQEGYDAAAAGLVGCPYAVMSCEAHSWHAGFVEGKAAREQPANTR
jgi:hypothetical protein